MCVKFPDKKHSGGVLFNVITVTRREACLISRKLCFVTLEWPLIVAGRGKEERKEIFIWQCIQSYRYDLMVFIICRMLCNHAYCIAVVE